MISDLINVLKPEVTGLLSCILLCGKIRHNPVSRNDGQYNGNGKKSKKALRFFFRTWYDMVDFSQRTVGLCHAYGGFIKIQLATTEVAKKQSRIVKIDQNRKKTLFVFRSHPRTVQMGRKVLIVFAVCERVRNRRNDPKAYRISQI